MNAKILSDVPVLHRAAVNSVVITRTQIIEVDGAKFKVDYWHHFGTGKLVKIDSNPVVE